MNVDAASEICKRICRAAMRADRDPGDIKLIAVTKTVGIEAIKDAAALGFRIFGENRVQEARRKIEEFAAVRDKEGYLGIEWHLIGHLQTNKAKYAAKLFDLIHTVDSVELAEELDRQAEKAGKTQRVLVQVKLSEEVTKQGVSEEGLLPLLEKVRGLACLKLEGLMTIPPFFDDPEGARPYFRRLREIKESAEQKGFHLPELSMGMSVDFEAAILEGATMVRIGTALFGERR
jgi:hypothetical protein